ncbi:MAG: ATP-binding protein [Acidimicrobiales bacterium]
MRCSSTARTDGRSSRRPAPRRRRTWTTPSSRSPSARTAACSSAAGRSGPSIARRAQPSSTSWRSRWNSACCAGRAEARAVAAANELRAALLAAVSHDLRTPLASVKAAVSSLRQRDVEWPVDVRDELLESIENGADRLTVLISNLLDMSRIQAGAVDLCIESVRLDEVVHRAAMGLAPRPVTLQIDLDDRLPGVAADAALLEHVVANLLDNAAKWSPPDGTVVVDAAAIDGTVHLRVVDRGPGIPASARVAVRRPFQRHDDSGSVEGTGLGLAVADGLARLMGIDLRLDDTPGGGATATLVIPLTVPPTTPTDPPEGARDA